MVVIVRFVPFVIGAVAVFAIAYGPRLISRLRAADGTRGKRHD
jgi:hypothetical protein